MTDRQVKKPLDPTANVTPEQRVTQPAPPAEAPATGHKLLIIETDAAGMCAGDICELPGKDD